MGSLGVVPNFGQIYNPDSFTGNGSTTTFTLSNLVTSDQSIIWIESGVTQKPGIDYTISGLTLTRTTAPANGVACFAMYLGVSVDVGTIGDSSVTLAKMADDAVGVAELSATGTASSSTFLRGDNAWAAAGGGSLVFINEVNISSTVGSADFLTSFSSTYDDYICYFDNFQVSTDTALGAVRIAIAGAAKTDATYAYGTASFTEAFGTSNGANTSSTHFRLSAGAWGAGATETGAGWVSFHGVNAAVQKFMNAHTSLIDYNVAYLGSYGGCAYQGATTAWSGFQFLSSGGNMKLGNFKLYGIKNS